MSSKYWFLFRRFLISQLILNWIGHRMNPKNNKFQLKFWFPELMMAANYNIHGKILLMPLTGTGMCTGNFSMFYYFNLVCILQIIFLFLFFFI